MRMVITTGELEEGAHHVSEDLYKAIVLVLLDNKSFPVVNRPAMLEITITMNDESTPYLVNKLPFEARCKGVVTFVVKEAARGE